MLILLLIVCQGSERDAQKCEDGNKDPWRNKIKSLLLYVILFTPASKSWFQVVVLYIKPNKIVVDETKTISNNCNMSRIALSIPDLI